MRHWLLGFSLGPLVPFIPCIANIFSEILDGIISEFPTSHLPSIFLSCLKQYLVSQNICSWFTLYYVDLPSVSFLCLLPITFFFFEWLFASNYQDYKVHRDEIHTKLVQIMRERLLVHLRGLPQIVESWNKQEENDSQPSLFARSLTKVCCFFMHCFFNITFLVQGDFVSLFL